MKFICSQNDLNNHLSLVSRAVPSRPTHPVLANVLLTADKETQRVSLTGFDLTLGIKTSFVAQVAEDGIITLPAKLLNDIVSRLPDGEMTVSDDETLAIATLTCASGNYQVRGMSAEEFPELPSIEDGQTVNLSGETLIEGLHGTLFATSGDETKQVLTGVHLTFGNEGLEFAATDGHRLAMVETFNQLEEAADIDDEDLDLNATVPARALAELERILRMKQSGNSETPEQLVSLHFGQGQVVFEWLEQRITSRLLEGQYPAYRQLLPPGFSNSLTVERKQFLSVLERISVLTDPKNQIVKATLDADNQKMTLSIEAKDVGSGRETIPIQFSGDSMEIAFNVKYLMESLRNISTQEVQMQLNTATSPVVLQPLGGAKATHLIMPVQLRN
ncbi:DNA polymerase III subunit beta [Phormidium sp. LEGE 05292]|uniref:DNA polymerase III subunit beta n=1 Tax=[Phormidium] sp. LEGE 05292 TaxID=767427 RepID=UPI00187F31E2|nr:DNA polymerase III subunit beta [Phormidium sp. LEGE 05292]MBE9226820.1 DNA polymerase III subunit beta [Phormidium sp. LEGE 05292]